MVATNEATIVSKPLLDPIIVENGQGDRRLADSAGTGKCDWINVLNEIDYFLDQLVATEKRPWWQRRGFSRYAGFRCEMMGPFMAQIADLALV